MMSGVYMRLWLAAALLLAGTILAACYSGISSEQRLRALPAQMTWETEKMVPEALETAVISYWGMRISDDWRGSYRLEAPHIRYLYSEEDYRNVLSGGQIIRQVRVMDISSCGNNCYEVKLGLHWGGSLAESGEIPLQEKWILVEGKYWHVLKTLLDTLKEEQSN
ncbi:MAG: hypothetical protein DRH10_06785 [Deltaproteobacteria bacterium]|nr:MAG: hypothetical protein DRH10_06785 [Deltaproteobacteria bacterium]